MDLASVQRLQLEIKHPSSSMDLSWTWHQHRHKGLILCRAVGQPRLHQLSCLQREEENFYHLLQPRSSMPSNCLELRPYPLTDFSVNGRKVVTQGAVKSILTYRNHQTNEKHSSDYQQNPLAFWKAERLSQPWGFKPPHNPWPLQSCSCQSHGRSELFVWRSWTTADSGTVRDYLLLLG